jgi:hypothetical protein
MITLSCYHDNMLSFLFFRKTSHTGKFVNSCPVQETLGKPDSVWCHPMATDPPHPNRVSTSQIAHHILKSANCSQRITTELSHPPLCYLIPIMSYHIPFCATSFSFMPPHPLLCHHVTFCATTSPFNATTSPFVPPHPFCATTSSY